MNDNYMHLGQITACGHCEPEKYGAGLADALVQFPNYVCDCKCHQESKDINVGGMIYRGKDIDEARKIIEASHPPSSIGEWETEIHALMNIAPSKYEVQRMVDYVRSLIQMAEERGRKDMYIEICELLKKEGTNSARQRKILQNCIEEVRASKGDDGQ